MKTSTLLISLLLMIFYGTNAQSNYNLITQHQNLFQKESKPLPSNVDANWYNEASKNIEESEYFFQHLEKENMYSTVNAKNAMRFDVKADGYVVSNIPSANSPDKWQTGFRMKSISRENNQWLPKPVSVLAEGNSLKIENKGFEMEYLNDRNGLRQNFIIKNKISGDGPLSVNLQLGKQMKYELSSNNKLLCYSGTGSTKNLRLIYDSLKVWDANGKQITAFMKLNNSRQLSIVVEDENAKYPLTIDPLNHAPEWTTSADGVLPGLLTNLQLQVDALYGFNVTALGDVNGDGYDDVAIGAPGAIDIIGASTIVGAGAVFVYFGSASGLSTTPSKVLRSNTPVLGALFGFSVAAGNVTGDSRNDIIVGAPGDSYSATVGGAPSTATVTAGKVYVISGEDLATANPSPTLSIYLNGSTFFSNGVLGVVGSNISIDALFGFSVAVADDMNGDGLNEIVVGSPGYAGLALLPVSSGAAFVYYSTALATNTPVELTAPTSALLGIPLLNTGGLLFGFSVDGAGDYNQDGKPDIVVGAPAGLNIGGGNLLGGSAYVYYGNGSGVGTAIGTELSATSSLVGNIANLFGFCVKGVSDASGKRNGNILVSAPIGNVLSNLVGGLKLKTGIVNVFVHNSAPGTSQLPTQQIASPRGNSLLSILGGQNLDVSALFGASMDNMLDVNCDGINDIIVGEPLSTGVGIVNANAVGGAAEIFLGKSDGTFQTTPFWTLENITSFDAGINAGSLLGFSVAGARHVRGAMQGVRALVGAPGAALDFSSGVLALGNTLGTLFNFAAGDNGLGKAYLYGFNDCGVSYNPDFNVTFIGVPVPGNVSTNDIVPTGTTYGTPVADGSNPASPATIVMATDGTYTFTPTAPGVYKYYVPVCLPGGSACTPVELKITVISPVSPNNPPIANTDIASTQSGKAVILRSLENDRCSNPGCSLNPSSVTILTNPSNGTASVNTTTGDITYTPNSTFFGKDTLTYNVCDNGSPSQCASATQIISVYSVGVQNTTLAADDFNLTGQDIAVSGNIKTNDTDPEGNSQSVTAQSLTLASIGTLNLSNDGSYSFAPTIDFTGPKDFVYTTCDNGVPSVCANATLHILVRPNQALSLNLLSFNYEVKDCGIKLNWTTSQEVNIKNFVVQNSQDDKNWKTIGSVTSRGYGSANTNYIFVPENPMSGQNFYRLVIYNVDGSYQYSNILSPVITCSNPVLSILPNPFSDKISIRFVADKNEQINIRLSDDAGKIIINNIIQAQEGGNNIILNNLSNLSSGVYILSIGTRDKVFVQKLVK